MAKDEAYRLAEQKIEEALRSGATELELRYNHLTELPESLGQLSLLLWLDIGRNQLTALPESLGQLTRLQRLDLSHNQLTALPESLSQLTQLQTLYLNDNQLAVLPESLCQLTRLLWLEIGRNQLMTLPESMGQLTRLHWLDLSHNQLTALPESLGQLKQLQTLDLSNNQLTSLAESLGQLTRLQTLNLSYNQLIALPESLGRLTQLQELNLRYNRLMSLPDWLGQLTQLERLWLQGNALTALPESMLLLTQLNGLDVEGIRELRIPPEIAGDWQHGAQATLDYYFSIRGEQGSALRELKLLVVGRGGAGKTSLVKRLNRHPLNPAESETHGINISPLELECQDGPVTARVWDFGGQHVLHAMHEFFLTARSLYLLVLGEREDMAERDAAYWLQLIRSYAGKAPVVVALNKNQGRPREMDRDSLEKNYGPILAWVPTECSEGFDDSIEDLRKALTTAVDGMKEVRDLFPRKWWEIKDWLENMHEPYLEFTTYETKCQELGEADEGQQKKLASWLNDLGIAINYADDERLHDMTVLRPDWLAGGIYAILRANDSHHESPLAPDAVLNCDRLGKIYAGAERLKMLNAVDYPKKMWPFLLCWMSQFQLAFPIDDTGDTCLVPTLLPLEPPPDCEEPEDKDRTRLRYEFAVVPGPLLPKFLVRTFSLIKDQLRWRRGAILYYGNARARVWTTQDERWIHVTAVGDPDDRNELLTMIRLTLEELITEYRDLQTVEQWEYKGHWVPRATLDEMGVLPVEGKSGEVER